MIDLTVDDPPSDKGKQKADVEMVDAPDWPGTPVALEEELPRWGQSTLEFRDVANPNAEPFFALNNKDEVQH
jgi:hypothetical protein